VRPFIAKRPGGILRKNNDENNNTPPTLHREERKMLCTIKCSTINNNGPTTRFTVKVIGI